MSQADRDSAADFERDRQLASRRYPFSELGVEGLQPEISSRLPAVEAVYRELDLPFEIVAAQTWRGHSFYSLHHTGYAVDVAIPTTDRSRTAQLVDTLRSQLGDDFRVLAFLETDPPHLHIEWVHGFRISQPVDDPWRDYSNLV